MHSSTIFGGGGIDINVPSAPHLEDFVFPSPGSIATDHRTKYSLATDKNHYFLIPNGS